MNIEIRPDKETYRQGDPVTGEVIISNAEKASSGDNIQLELWELVQGTGAGAGLSRLKDERELSGEFTFSPREERSFRFEVQLPKNCRISRKSDPGTYNAAYWDLRVRVKTSKLKMHTKEHTIQVNPAWEIEAVYEACTLYMNFKPYGGGEPITWSTPSVTKFLLDSKSSSNPYVSQMYFRLLQDEPEGVSGTVEFGLERLFAKSLFERIMALFKMGPSITRPIKLSASQISLPDGSVNHDEITKAINNIIDEVVASRR